MLTYKVPLEIVNQYVVKHREFLDGCYKNNFFIASGPRNPKTGGVIISQLNNREQVATILKQDPFAIHDIADFEIIEFDPIKYHPDFSVFIK